MTDRRTFLRFALPSVLAFALSGVYTIVDGYFVGNSLGDPGLAAINLAYPIPAFIQAAGTGIGLSGAIRYSILIGQKRQSSAMANSQPEERRCFTCTLLLLLLASLLLTAGVLAALPSLLRLLGANGSLYGLAAEYTQAIAWGTIFQLLATGLVPFIRNLGGSSYAMFTMIAGFLTNIALDYVFVWVWHWGIAGAAWATVVGQTVTAVAAAGYLIWKKIGFSLPCFKSFLQNAGVVLKVAVAPFGLTFSPQITTILMNRALMEHSGEQAVAVYGCIAYIIAIPYLLLQGVGDGSQPLISQAFGAGDKQGVKQVRRFAYFSGGTVALLCMACMFLLRDRFGVLFGASSAANAEVALRLPLFLSTLLLLAYVRITTSFLYATERAGLSYLLVYAEPAALFVLLLFLPCLPFLGGLGVWFGVPAAQLLTWCAALVVKRQADRPAS